MQMLVGMALLLAAIASGLAPLVGLLVVVMTIPDLFRVVRALRTSPSMIAQAEGRAAVQGVIEADVDPPFPAYGDGAPVVFRRLVVTENVGGKTRERFDGTESCRFAIVDGTGRMGVDATNARVLSPLVFADHAPPPVVAHAGAVFAWAETPKSYVEEVLRPGDFVTVVGTVNGSERSIGDFRQPVTIVRGEPRLLATGEVRTTLGGLAAIPVGAALCWGFVQLLNAWI